MRYTVEVAGESLEVRVEQGPQGLLVAVGAGELEPARWGQVSGALRTLEWGPRRCLIRSEPDPLEPGGQLVTLPGRTPLALKPVDERTRSAQAGRASQQASGPSIQRSAMPGVIVEVNVSVGDAVVAGQVLLILEAMKMQNEIKALAPGRVAALHVSPGDTVPAGAKLVEFAPPAE